MPSTPSPSFRRYSSCASRSAWRFSLGLAALLTAAPAAATLAIQGSAGGGVGVLQAGSSYSVRAYPMLVALQYEGRFFGLFGYMLSGIVQHQAVAYEIDGKAYDGSNQLTGGSLGVNLLSLSSSFLRLEGAYFPQNELTFSAETKAAVNGVTYRHSTLTTYTGPGASQVSLTCLIEFADGQFSKHERGRMGFALDYLTQPIDKYDTRIAASSRAVAPASQLAGTASYSYTMAALRLVFAFAF